ncbi:MAG: 16S rRNA (uracil(1498)-N(3))-methyltransferase [Gammaproteobacteria bacterium]|nr:MAG: 16S rRNA (uracil(1498)-N(3))-methyltransferase [Gammaproteobacteria bacterium]
MRIPRVFSTTKLEPGNTVRLDDNAGRHLLHSLRLQSGAAIVLFDGSGADFAAELSSRGKREAWAKIGEVLRTEPPPALRLQLALGISRGERMDFALQKAVELGVWEIQPLFTERTLVRLKGPRLASRMAHWRGIVRHACEQSGRALLPRLLEPCPLESWLNHFNGRGLLLDPRAAQTLTAQHPPDTELALLVGPEGGLSDAERRAAYQAGLQGIRLGPRILRAETAPLAALAAIQALWGDFR